MPRIRTGVEDADDAINRNIDAQNDTTGNAYRRLVEDADEAIDDTEGNGVRIKIVEDATELDTAGNARQSPVTSPMTSA